MTRGNASVSLSSQVERHVASRPNAPFLITDDATVSWREIHHRAGVTAAGLAAVGVGPAENVVIGLNNSLEFIETWFGLAYLGAVEVPVSSDAVGDRLAHIVNHSQARVAVVDAEMIAAFEALADRLDHLEHLVAVGEANPVDLSASRIKVSRYEEIADGRRARASVTVDPSHTAAILYTSGTTGYPKGVMVPYGQHHTNGRQGAAAAQLTADDVLYLCLPLHHNMAQGYGVWPALVTGCSVRLADKFDRRRFWTDVRESRSTVWPFVGSLLALLIGSPEQTNDADNPLRVAYGVPIPQSLHRRFEQRFGLRLVHGYGMTEATIPVWSDDSCPVGSAGRQGANFDVSVQDDDGNEVPFGVVGEICVRPHDKSQMFTGYFRDPGRTAAAWRNGWFRSGDRGSFDSEGCLWFRGRTGDAIRRFGEFVDPEEVENAALAHQGVLNAACFGVLDEVAGEEVALAVMATDRALTTDEVRRHLIERLPRSMVPRYVGVLDQLPMTETGKVQRFRLKEQGIGTAMDDFRSKEGHVING